MRMVQGWKKRGWTAVLTGCLLLAMGQGAVAEESCKLTLNGRELAVDPAPVNRGGTILVPLRLLFEEMGATVDYDPETGKITGTRGEISIQLQVGSLQAMRNGGNMPLEQAPVLIGEKTYVPARFVAEAFGAEVSWEGETSTVQVMTMDRTLEHNEELAVVNDQKKHVFLSHQGNARVVWYWQDEINHSSYGSFAGADGFTYFISPQETLIVDREGKLLDRQPRDTKNFEITTALKKNDSFTISIKSGETNHTWSNISLSNDEDSIYSIIPNGTYMNTRVMLDGKGNLILVDSEGLAAYDPDGKRLWMHKEWTDPAGAVISARAELRGGGADSRGNLYIAFDQGFVVLNEAGETLAVKSGEMFPTVLPDGIILEGGSGSTYRLKDGKLESLGVAFSGGKGAYASIEGEKAVSRIDPGTGAQQWTYTLPRQEQNMGYDLFTSTLSSDKAGNMYISTSGGSVHSLDREGNLRFILHVDNKVISWAEVLPLSESRCVVMVNNSVLLLEIGN